LHTDQRWKNRLLHALQKYEYDERGARGVITVGITVVDYFLEHNQLDSARLIAAQVVHVAGNSQEQRVQARLRELEAKLAAANGDFVLAIQKAHECRVINQRGDDHVRLPTAFSILSTAWRQLGRADSALYYAQALQPLATNLALQKEMYEKMQLAHQALGNYKRACHYHDQMILARDSLLDAEKLDQLAYVELQKKQADNLVLQQKVDLVAAQTKQQKAETERATQALYAIVGAAALLLILALLILLNRQRLARIKQQLETQRDAITEREADKTLLLKEIHHRVKNSLQMISGLLDLQADQVVDKPAFSAVREGKSRVKSIALIHQKLYQNENLSEVDFTDYLERLNTAIADTFPAAMPVQCTIEAPNIALDIDTALPLGLILNELLSNAYKYAFGNAESVQQVGKLKVQISRKSDASEGTGTYVLTVADNGPGLAEGFNLQKTRTLGMRLVLDFAEQLQGALSVANRGGAEFTLEFRERSLS